MSIDRECVFIQVSQSEWFYLIGPERQEKWDRDWMEEAIAFGPFAGSTYASEHLQLFYPGTQGYRLHHLPDFCQHLNLNEDPLLAHLIQNARAHPQVSALKTRRMR